MTNKISEIISTAADKAEVALKENSVLGDPINVDGTMIIPVYKLSFGFGGGGFDSTGGKENVAGGAGAGITKKPVAYITVANGKVSVLNAEAQNDGIFSKIFSAISKKGK